MSLLYRTMTATIGQLWNAGVETQRDFDDRQNLWAYTFKGLDPEHIKKTIAELPKHITTKDGRKNVPTPGDFLSLYRSMPRATPTGQKLIGHRPAIQPHHLCAFEGCKKAGSLSRNGNGGGPYYCINHFA